MSGTPSPSFSHAISACRVHCGEHSLRQLPVELDRLGCRRAAILCGRTLAASAELRAIIDALGARHAGTFDGVTPHSPLPDVIAAAEALRAMQADAVVAVGGGSAVVSGRAAAIALAEGSDLHALCTQYPPGRPPVSPKLSRPKLPQFVVATTPTTAYAKAGSAVLDPQARRRLTLFDPRTRAQAVFLHPALALTAPRALVLDAALQALASAVQGLESAGGDALAHALLMHALRLLAQQLPRLGPQGEGDGDTRLQLMQAAFLAGRGTDHAPLGLAAALSHSLGARCGTGNGATGALLLAHTLRFNASVSGEGQALVADALGGASATAPAVPAAVALVQRLLLQTGSPLRLREAGVERDALPGVAEDALGDWFLHQNPRKVAGVAELLALLEAAW